MSSFDLLCGLPLFRLSSKIALMRRVLCLMCPQHFGFRLRTSSINWVSPVISLSRLMGYNWRKHYNIVRFTKSLVLTVCLIADVGTSNVTLSEIRWMSETVKQCSHLYHQYWKLDDRWVRNIHVWALYMPIVRKGLDECLYDMCYTFLLWVSVWSSVTLGLGDCMLCDTKSK